MISKITQALFPKKETPSQRCVGEVWQGNLRARVLEIHDSIGVARYWIGLDRYQPTEETWQNVGLLSCEKLEEQFAVLRQITDYLIPQMAARGVNF